MSEENTSVENMTLQELHTEHQGIVSGTLIRRADLLQLTRKDPNIGTAKEQAEREWGIIREARERVYAEMDRYEQAYADRKARVEAHLYNLNSPESASLISRVVGAPAEDLAGLLDAAIRSGNRELGKAVFSEADRRGLTGLTHRYFEALAPEDYGLYVELANAPTEEDLQRERNNLQEITRGPDGGFGWARQVGRGAKNATPLDRGLAPGPYQATHDLRRY